MTTRPGTSRGLVIWEIPVYCIMGGQAGPLNVTEELAASLLDRP